MKRVVFLILFLLGLSGAMQSCAAPSGGMSAADAAAIRQVVQSQLDALAQDNAEAAFALATPARRGQIGTADNFLQLIKTHFLPMYRHLGLIFSQAETIDGNPIQVVRITDSSNHVWIAIFWMEQGENRDWKIDGCQLLETATVSI